MYKMKFIFGQTVIYNGTKKKIKGIRFTSGGVMYLVNQISRWIREDELTEWSYKGKNINK